MSPDTRPRCENFARIVNTHYNSVVKIFLLKISTLHVILLNIIPSFLDLCPSNELCNILLPWHVPVMHLVLYHIHLVQLFVLYRTNIPLCWIRDRRLYEGLTQVCMRECINSSVSPDITFCLHYSVFCLVIIYVCCVTWICM